MRDLFQVEGRCYLVTGAASGIGRATALLLSEMGAKVLLADIDVNNLERVKTECDNEADTLVIDLMDADKIKNLIKEKTVSFGKLHGFVHCAGLPYIAPLKVVNAEKADRIYKLNTYAAIELAKACSNKQIYAGEYGSFVLISSVYGLVGSAANVGYAMSKGAIVAITKSLASNGYGTNRRCGQKHIVFVV